MNPEILARARCSSLIADLKLLPKTFYLMITGSFISRFGYFVIPFLAIYVKQLGYSPDVTGYALGGYGLGGLTAAFSGGYLADKLGRKPTMLISSFGASIAMLNLGFATQPHFLIGGAFLCGAATAMYYPASSSLIIDIVPEALRVRAFAVQRFAGNLAFALGMCSAGLIASSSFTLLFVLDAATSAALGIIILFGLPRGIGKKARATAGWLPALKSISTDRIFLRGWIASFIVAIIFWQTSSTYGLEVTGRAGLSEKYYGVLLGLNGLMIVCLELPLTSWTRRFAPQKIISLGYFLTGFGLALLFFGSNLAMLTLAMVILTIGEMIAMPVKNGFIASLAPDEMRGRYMGIFGLSWSLAITLGPMVGIRLYTWSPDFVWVGCGVLGILAAMLMLPMEKLKAEETT